jgi:glycosyltransferase involved in cell wall biosynthesis
VLVNPEDPVGMAEAISRLLQNPSVSSQIASNARTQVEKYTWPAVGDQWAAVYDEVVATRLEPAAHSFPSHV